MKCAKCGREVKNEIKFCPNCGEKLSKKETKHKKFKRLGYILLTVMILAVFLWGLKKFVFTPAEGKEQLELPVSEKYLIDSVEVDYKLTGIGGKIRIEILNNENDMHNVAGIQGEPIDISAIRQEVKSAKISFHYDETAISDDEAQKLAIAYYNEELGRMEILNNSKLDTTENIVSVDTEHFSRYVVVNSEEWYEAWARSQLVVRDESQAQNYFNIIFAIDCSGSMNDDNKNELSKECTYEFIQTLYAGDYFTLIKFNDKAQTVIEGQMVEDIVSWENIYAAIQQIDANGGTNIENAINSSITLSEISNKGVMEFIVLLSDGQSSLDEDTLQKAKEAGIKIITIGFGKDADEELLTKIAEYTGGKYYKAEVTNISKIFELIREEYVGVDIKNDSDSDGIPDEIESSGMRNQYGTIIYTDPKKADTDGDGVIDGIEMGEFVVDEDISTMDKNSGLQQYTYFEMVTDPTKYNEDLEYSPKAEVELQSNVSNDKASIRINVQVANAGYEKLVESNSNNSIDDIENINVSFTVPGCMSADKINENLGNIKNGEYNETEKEFTHDSKKCNGEKHIVIVKISADNLAPISKEIRLSNLYWYEDLSEESYNSPIISLIKKVRGYSSTYDETKINSVLSDKSMTQDEMADFWEREKENCDLRWQLNYLCNNDIYVAHGFRIYMEEKGVIEKGIIDVSKLIFNDGAINTVISNPEKDRYKQMLLDYISSTMEEQQKQNQIAALLDGYQDVISSYEKLVSDLEGQQAILQQECITAVNTINQNLEYLKRTDRTVDGICQRIQVLVEQGEILKKNNVNVNVTETISSNVLEGLETERNRLSGISKAVTGVGLVVSISSDAIEMFKNVTQITSVAQTYSDYEKMLDLIINKTEYSELKAAAEELKEELNDKYKLYANESWDFLTKTGVNTLQALSGVSLADFCGTASGIVADVGLAATVTKLVLNVALGIDDLLEKSVYVIGASEIADILAEKLVECRNEFNEQYHKSLQEAYEAAEEFKYYYVQLQQMRVYGEEQYLSMKGMDGAWEIFGDLIKEWNQYEEAHEICRDTITKVKEMKF